MLWGKHRGGGICLDWDIKEGSPEEVTLEIGFER